MRRDAPRGSLQRRVESVGAVMALLLLLGISALLALSGLARSQLVEGTAAFVEEQRIADRITRGVARQLALASTFPTNSGPGLREEFLTAGEEVHDQIREYLFRDLSAEERLQLEEMREAHQHFEVVAVQAAELFARQGDPAEAQVAVRAVTDLSTSFLDALDQFLAMREEDLVAIQRRQERIFRVLFVAGGAMALGVLLASSFLAWELNRRVARPLAELSQATERVAEGEMEARVPPAADDEFQALAESFNRMASSLQRRDAELRAALDEVQATQADLVQAEKLGAIGRMSAGFAHELNNPLTSVVGYAELMQERLEQPEPLSAHETREMLGPILREASRARALVRSFLQVSRRPQASLGPVSVRQALDVVVALRSYAFQQAGLTLQVDPIPDVHVRAEPQMLQGIFLNLVNNALDAMRPRGHGTLVIRGRMSAPDQLEVVAEDDGPGLRQVDRVFEPFFTTKPVGEGTGLGLSLVHQFVTAFGGQVRAENRPEGGALFTMHLRVVDAPSVDTDSAPASPLPPPAKALPPTSPSTAGEESGGAQGPRVLVVEDEAHLRTLQARILSRLHARVWEAGSVAEARTVLEQEDVDLVVSDVKMPGASGVDLYRWIVTERPSLERRFLFITGDSSAPELEEVVAREPELLLRKPFQVADYLARVQAILDRAI